MKIVAYTTLDRSRLILAEKRNKTNSAAVANRYSVPLVEAATVERLAEAGDRLLNAGYGQAINDGRLGDRSDLWVEFRAALAAFRGDA